MCDTLVALPPATAGGVVFGKNSDRERNEAQAVELHPAAEHAPGSLLRVTRIGVPQVRRTRAVLISRPYWMWGAEMGANDAGVVIGNEAVHSVVAAARAPALLGMDLVRLGLERGGSAAEACQVIGGLLEAHGQGGNCGHLHPHFYHNSFIVADAAEAFVLETVGREWSVERASGVRTISNAYTLAGMRGRADVAAETRGDGPGRCARTGRCWGRRSGGSGWRRRWWRCGTMARMPARAGIRRTRWGGRCACMRVRGSGGRRRWGSMVSELRAGGAVHWVTGTAAPCTGVFKPFTFGAGVLPAGPVPTGRADGSLWWGHERLHRALVLGGGVPAWLSAERDALEAGFRAVRLDAAGVEACWAAAAEAEARWLARVERDVRARADFAGSWQSLGALAGMPG